MYSSPNIDEAYKSRRLNCVGHVMYRET